MINDHALTTLAFGLSGGTEWIVILAIGLLLFGRRLPEVGRSLGRGIVEFKKGVRGIEDEIESASTEPSRLESKSPADMPGAPATSGANADAGFARDEQG